MDTEEVVGRIGQYAEIFQRATKLLNDKDAALVIVQEMGKHLRIAQMVAARENSHAARMDGANGDRPATRRQLEYLRDLGLKVSTELTRTEASAMLDEALAA